MNNDTILDICVNTALQTLEMNKDTILDMPSQTITLSYLLPIMHS